MANGWKEGAFGVFLQVKTRLNTRRPGQTNASPGAPNPHEWLSSRTAAASVRPGAITKRIRARLTSLRACSTMGAVEGFVPKPSQHPLLFSQIFIGKHLVGVSRV